MVGLQSFLAIPAMHPVLWSAGQLGMPRMSLAGPDLCAVSQLIALQVMGCLQCVRISAHTKRLIAGTVLAQCSAVAASRASLAV